MPRRAVVIQSKLHTSFLTTSKLSDHQGFDFIIIARNGGTPDDPLEARYLEELGKMEKSK